MRRPPKAAFFRATTTTKMSADGRNRSTYCCTLRWRRTSSSSRAVWELAMKWYERYLVATFFVFQHSLPSSLDFSYHSSKRSSSYIWKTELLFVVALDLSLVLEDTSLTGKKAFWKCYPILRRSFENIFRSFEYKVSKVSFRISLLGKTSQNTF